LYSFAHPEAVRQILLDPARALIKGRAAEWVRRDLGMALPVADGEDHTWRRAALQPAFARTAVHGYAGIIGKSVAETVRRWKLQAGRTVDVRSELSELTLRVIGEIAFGDDFTQDARRLQQMLIQTTDALGKLFGTVSQSLPRWVPTALNRDIERLMREVEPVLTAVIERRRRAPRASADLIGSMTCPFSGKQAGAPSRGYQTNHEILSEIKGLVGGGYETTAHLLTWALYFLATHPKVECKLAAEVEAAAPDRPVTLADLPKLPYTKRVIHETLRLMPPLWAILREAKLDTEIAGVPISKGSFVGCSPYVTQRDPRWYPEPLRFLPERDELYPPAPSFAYFPFGRGLRFCIGKELGELEGQLALAELARNFEFQFEAGRFVTPVTRLTVAPEGGLTLRIEPRRRSAEAYEAAGAGLT
jgi:cytochrome P450